MSESDGNSTEVPRSGDVRIGDAEREQALTALGEHLSAGRLDIDEYGERSAVVTAARTRQDLTALFTDLPDPRPVFGPAVAPPAPAAPAVPAPEPVVKSGSYGAPVRRVAASLMGVSWIAGFVLAGTTHIWWLIFLPLALSVVFGSVWGNNWRHGTAGGHDRELRDRRREEWRDRQIERRERHRDRYYRRDRDHYDD
ncbi:MAG: DUF1707 domain-containing protein [Actinocatenispora sp.]